MRIIFFGQKVFKFVAFASTAKASSTNWVFFLNKGKNFGAFFKTSVIFLFLISYSFFKGTSSSLTTNGFNVGNITPGHLL